MSTENVEFSYLVVFFVLISFELHVDEGFPSDTVLIRKFLKYFYGIMFSVLSK